MVSPHRGQEGRELAGAGQLGEGRGSSYAPTPPFTGKSRTAETHDYSKGLVNRPGMESHPEAAEVGNEGEDEAAGFQPICSSEPRSLGGPQRTP